MSFTSRLLRMASLLLAVFAGQSSYAFNITTPVTGPVDTSTTGGVLNEDGDHTVSNEGSVTVDGTPAAPGAVVIIDHSDTRNVVIDGPITVNDRSEDEITDFDANNAIGVLVGDGAPVSGDITFGSLSHITLVDDKPLADEDGDEYVDGIYNDSGVYVAGSFAQDDGRIGVYVPQNLTGDLIALNGARVTVTSDNGGGFIISGDISGRINISPTLNYRGADTSLDTSDDAVGIGIYGDVTDFVRVGGSVSVTGANTVGLRVSGDLTRSLQLEGSISTTGFTTIGVSNAGDPDTMLDVNELGTSTATVKLTGNVGEGVLIGGNINAIATPSETASLEAITQTRIDGGDVTGLKTLPFQYDENRLHAAIASHGPAPALILDGGTYGSVVEQFVDTTNDGGDGTADSLYLTQTFNYSHSLINRGTITAHGLNDGYAATAVEIGRNAPTVLSGGILNAGSILAEAYNNDAIALALMAGADIQNGGRTRGDVFLNEGNISATVTTNVATKSDVTSSTHTATAITLDAATSLPVGAEFINRGQVAANNLHIDADGETSLGTAIAFDFSARTDNISLTQELRRNDELDPGLDKYLANGDLDLDRSGIINDAGEAEPDGVVTTADVVAPSIFGDIIFGSGNDTLTASAGSINGAIDFGSGANVFTLTGAAPETQTTSFAGTLTSSGTLDVTVSGLSSLTLVEQEELGSAPLSSLTLDGAANLGVIIDPAKITPGMAVIVADTLVLNGDEYTISPHLTALVAEPYSFTIIETGSDLSALNDTINNQIGSEVGYVYNVELSTHDLGATQSIDATFSLKSAEELGLNTVETAAYPVVLSYFTDNAALGHALTDLNDAESFTAAFDQILPQYGDGTMLLQAAMLEAANGAVGERLRLITKGGQARAHWWVQQQGAHIDRTATSEAPEISGSGFGIAFGYDARVGRLDALGILGQMMWTNIDEGNGALSDAHAEMFGLGAYAAENFGPVLWNLNATVGIGSMRSERTVTVSSVSDLLSADWDGTQYAVSTGLQVPMLKGAHKLQAEISGDYYRLDHDNFSETETYNSGLAMQVENGNSSLASASIGLRGQYDVATRARDDISVVPSYFLGYRSIVAHDRYQADVSFVGGGERFTVMSQDMPEDRAIIGVSLAANNPYFALEVGSRSEFGGDTEIISGGASLRVNF